MAVMKSKQRNRLSLENEFLRVSSTELRMDELINEKKLK
jgi:hypothetical protein